MDSFLGKTLIIEGDITSDEFLTINGTVKGKIKTSKTLTIGKSGDIDGEINAENVIIDGKAKGTIKATNKFEITPNGDFKGCVKSDKIVINEGALFQGKANLDENPDFSS